MTLHIPNLSTETPAKARASVATSVAPPASLYRLFFKRALDVALVLISAPVVLPMILMLALLIAATGNVPFYSQLRVGRGGNRFRMWKLRTMVRNADQHLEAYLAQNPTARREWDATQKLKNDP
ncbi:MAG: sugar transferase, partial [Roseobacter sp.]